MQKKKILLMFSILILIFSVSFFNPYNSIVKIGSAQFNYERLFYLDLIHARGAWKLSNGSKDITVAVIDSGIDFSHSELYKSAWVNEDEIADNGIDDDSNGYIDDIHGWDFVFNDSNPGPYPEEIHWHGTFIAGIIAAPLNGTGPAGIAQDVTIMDVRVLNSTNYHNITYEAFGDALRYAVDNGADVINLSLQYYSPSADYYDDILYAVSQNVAVVSVTGNTYPPDGGKYYQSYPGGYAEVIAVGATAANGEDIADYSNYGEWTELVAPVGSDGETRHIYSTVPFYTYGTLYGWGTGTSFACPQVAGVIALMKSVNNSLSLDDIREILQDTATDLGDAGKDNYFGYGMLNASAALEALFPPTNGNREPTDNTSIKFIPALASFILLTAVVILYKRRK
jgi:subtilisin family serine protease